MMLMWAIACHVAHQQCRGAVKCQQRSLVCLPNVCIYSHVFTMHILMFVKGMRMVSGRVHVSSSMTVTHFQYQVCMLLPTLELVNNFAGHMCMNVNAST